MHKTVWRGGAWVSGLFVATVLSACGGGGDSAPPPVTPAVVAPTAIPDNLAIQVPASAESATAVAFTSNAASLTGLKFKWDFGDGSTSTEAAPSHGYAAGGSYDVVLKVTNEAGTTQETRTRLSITNLANVRGLECTGTSNTGWCWQNPRPTGNRVNTVFFLDAKTGWRGGEAGEIFKTTDGGATWARQATGITAAISAIRFADARNGWATGAYGAFLRTTDGGSSWVVSKVGDPSVIYDPSGLTLLGASTVVVGRTGDSGFASGLLLSGDGGSTWRTVSPAPTAVTSGSKFWDWSNYSLRVSSDGGLTYTQVLNLRSPDYYTYFDSSGFIARDDQRAVAFARTSTYDYSVYQYVYITTVYVTVDGGTTWNKVASKGSSPTLQRLLRLSEDGKTLLATANGGALARSTDGGANWTVLPAPSTDPYASYYVAYRALGDNDVAAFYSGTAWLSGDGGLSWFKLGALPAASSGSSAPTFSPDGLRRLDATTLLASDGQGGTYISKDKGQSWTRIVAPVDTSAQLPTALAFRDARNGFMVDTTGRSFFTSDGGLNWQLKNASFGTVRTVQFVNATTGWLVGSDNRPYKTTDGGQTWLTVPTALGVNYAGLYFQSETLGWSQRSSGGAPFAVTRDGGKTWIELPLPAGVNRLRLGDAAWLAVGPAGAIYVSTDSGATWNAVYTGTPADLRAAAFSDAKTAWVVGGSGTVLKSDDAGAHWVQVKLPGVAAATLNDIRFVSAKVGWIVGDAGLILQTQDGGKTWQIQSSGTSQPLYSVQAVDTNTAWITGGGGTVLATGTGGN